MKKVTKKGTKKERRKYRRVSILQDLFFGEKALRPMEGLSENGMFISSPDVFLKGSILDLKFTLFNDRKPISVKSEVRNVVKGVGMGIRFLDLKSEDRRRIRLLVRKLAKA